MIRKEIRNSFFRKFRI